MLLPVGFNIFCIIISIVVTMFLPLFYYLGKRDSTTSGELIVFMGLLISWGILFPIMMVIVNITC